jgi:hypothetical protein
VIFPIVTQEPSGLFRLIGTGFFITENGLFVSAKHVLLAVLDTRQRQVAPIGLFQFLPNNAYVLRPILRCTSHEVADVAVGVAAPIHHNQTGGLFRNKVLTLTADLPKVGTQVATYAYPASVLVAGEPAQQLHFNAGFYSGVIQDYFPSGRDRAALPAPCFQTSMHIHSGASGGPVFGNDGRVFGINSTGWDGTDLSFVSRIVDILSLRIPGIVTPESAEPRDVRVHELATDGFIAFRPPLTPAG